MVTPAEIAFRNPSHCPGLGERICFGKGYHCSRMLKPNGLACYVAPGLGALAVVLSLPAGVAAQTDVELIGRQHGATPPASYYEMLRSVPGAFQFSQRNGWVVRGRTVAAIRSRARGRLMAARRNAPTTPLTLLVQGQAANPVLAGELNVPVFLILYSDTDSAGLVQNVPRAALEQRLYGTNPAPPYSVHTYYRELSNDSLLVNGTVYEWTRVSETSLYYEGDGNGLDNSGNIPELIDEVVSALDGSVDFGEFDNDGPDGIANSGDDDGYVDAIVLIHPKVDGSCKNRNPAAQSSIWAHRYKRSGWLDVGGQHAPFVTNDLSPTGDSILVDDYIIQGGQGGNDGCTSDQPQAMGVVAHETGHLLGLPDLYDTVGDGAGIGRWGLMGSGNHLLPDRPAHMTAWSKAELGWVTEVVIDRDTTLEIGPIISSDTSYILPIPHTSEYLIVENRQPIGSDVNLYSAGLLVWHPDTFLINGRGNDVNGYRPYGMALVQADGRDDLEQGANRGDEGDAFPGIQNNTTLGVCTTPSTASNDGRPSLAVVDSITQVVPLGPIRANIRYYQPDPLTVVERSLPSALMGEPYFFQFVATGGIDCDYDWRMVSGSLPAALVLNSQGRLAGQLEETGEFTADVEVRSGDQAHSATVTLSVEAPVLVVDDVVEHLLGAGTPLTFFELTYLDLLGNNSGGFDIGDFLGWIETTGGLVSAAEMVELLNTMGAPDSLAGRKP